MRSILDAAILDFEENGYANASIVQITSKSNVALGSFYTYFSSKEEIYLYIIHDISEHILRFIKDYIESDGSPEGRERLYVKAIATAYYDNKGMFKIIDESEFVSPDNYRLFYSRITAHIAESLRREDSHQSPHNDETDKTTAWLITGMGIFLGKMHTFSNDSIGINNFDKALNNLIK